MKYLECLREDFRANTGNSKGLFIVMSFRPAHSAGATQNTILRLAGKIPVLIYKIFVNWILCIDLDHHVNAGPGLRIFHGQGLVVNGETTLGRSVTLRHNTTVGNKVAGDASPIIGSGVDVGANSVIIRPVHIADEAVVAAGSVVVHDVAEGDVVAGNPARSIDSVRKTS